MTTAADELEAIRQRKARYYRLLGTKGAQSRRDVFHAPRPNHRENNRW